MVDQNSFPCSRLLAFRTLGMSSGHKRALSSNLVCEGCSYPAADDRALSIHTSTCPGRRATREELINRARQTQAAKRMRHHQVLDSESSGGASSQGSELAPPSEEDNSDQVCVVFVFDLNKKRSS